MSQTFNLRGLTIIVFSMYIFWGSFGVDITLHPAAERIPLHRVFMLLTALIILSNAHQVFVACLKNKMVITLLLYVLLTALWAGNPSVVYKNFLFLSSLLFISIMTALAFADKKVFLIRWLFWLFLLMTLASIITAFYFPQIGINTTTFGVPRWIGITAHPNGLGVQALALIWLSSNLYFLSESKPEKKLIFFALIAAFFTIIQADSMTSLITSVIITSYVCYYYLFRQLSLPIKFLLFTIFLLSFLFIVASYISSSELTTTTLKSTGRDATFTGRTVLWEKALTSAADQIIFGYGFDNLEQMTKKHHLEMSHLHNGYIQVLVQGGMIATLLLVVIFIKTFFSHFRIRSTHKYDFIFLHTGLILVLLHNITESSMLLGLSVLNIFTIFIIASTSLIANNKDKVSLTSQ
ncbi:O-antigen ligase family protein [Methylomicrobium lacus]|uniref:O-antigen ligase family protein n=1 Tax=Methylomicrobium lacus TaxID=136992 RepID=UPI0035A972DC